MSWHWPQWFVAIVFVVQALNSLRQNVRNTDGDKNLGAILGIAIYFAGMIYALQRGGFW